MPIRPEPTIYALRESYRARGEALEELLREVIDYVETRDLRIEELPENSPLRAAIERARAELAKDAASSKRGNPDV